MELPHRPLSAYNIFFREERIKIPEQLPPPAKGFKPRTVHGKIGFAELSKSIAKKWKQLEDKSKYEDQAREDEARYAFEMEAWREHQAKMDELAGFTFCSDLPRSNSTHVVNHARGVSPSLSSSENPTEIVSGRGVIGRSTTTPRTEGAYPIPTDSLYTIFNTWDDQMLDFFIGAFKD